MIDFENINKDKALNLMKLDFEVFLAALVKMKMVDNFDHTLPNGLSSFAKFYFSYHKLIYKNQEDPHKIYTEFLKWLNR
ncbi:MAG: hypothetical protein ACFFB0_07905 [Promethearchaeota archaeon]